MFANFRSWRRSLARPSSERLFLPCSQGPSRRTTRRRRRTPASGEKLFSILRAASLSSSLFLCLRRFSVCGTNEEQQIAFPAKARASSGQSLCRVVLASYSYPTTTRRRRTTRTAVFLCTILSEAQKVPRSTFRYFCPSRLLLFSFKFFYFSQVPSSRSSSFFLPSFSSSFPSSPA